MKREMDNCVAEAQMSLADAQAREDSRIKIALDTGMFAVVCDSDWRCNSTDASVGTYRSMKGAFATRDQAEGECFAYALADDESRYMVLPALPVSLGDVAREDGLRF